METSPQKKIIDRLSRAEGQIRSLKQKLEITQEHDCKAFITQIRAARSALRAVSDEYVKQHIHMCQKLPPTERDQQIAEAIDLLNRD